MNLLQIDNNNRLIIGLNTGIDILSLDDFYKGKITVKHFGQADGLLNLECNGNAVCKDKDGRILIGTISGLEIYDSKLDKKNTIEPITQIQKTTMIDSVSSKKN